MVNEDELGGGAIGGLLGQFSGLLGSGEELNFQKILEIGRTRKIAEKVFFRSVEMNGKSNLLANHFIEIPQFGTKHSLNVSVAAGIVAWHFLEKILLNK